MRKKTLPGHLRRKVTQGLRRATIRSLGYDRKASRTVSQYFSRLSLEHQIRPEQISLQIKTGESDQESPEVRLFLRGKLHSELPSGELIRIFAGEALAGLTSFREEVHRRVGGYLNQLAAQKGRPVAIRIFLAAGKPVLHTEFSDQIGERLEIVSVIEHFYDSPSQSN